MNQSDSKGDAFDAAHSLSSGLFNAAGVQVKGICGSSFITDVIRVERNGVENAVKILTPGATKDPEIVSRFLSNARYNKALGEFTSMPITEIVETGPRPYYVMQRVAESSLLEIIRLHAPIDPLWLASLILPIAKSLDTIHQRSVLHANIKPSNLLVVVENGQEKILLVDFLEPSLAATSATITGAGIYAAPEFRAGTPVSNRSDIYSLASVIYEGLSASAPNGPRRTPDGSFHVWRKTDRPVDLTIANPEIPRPVSDVVMSGLSPQAISRPATATVMVEEMLRHLEQPKTRVRVEAPAPVNTPVPMLLIAVGVFLLTLLLLFGGIRLFGALTGGSDETEFPTPTSRSITTDPDRPATQEEVALASMIPPDHNTCNGDGNEEGQRRFMNPAAILDCVSTDVEPLTYALFANKEDFDATFATFRSELENEVGAAGGTIVPNAGDPRPCSASPHENANWGITGSTDSLNGSYICVSTPYPRIIWTEESNLVIGVAELRNGPMSDLATWWIDKAGPQ